MPSAFVAGAGGAVGEAVAHHLRASGWNVIASMHQRRAEAAARLEAAGAKILTHDLDSSGAWWADARACDAWIFTTHLERTLAAVARADCRIPRLVAFSSNNVAIHPEAPAYRRLGAAEQELRSCAPTAAIVRPTLIYGDGRLKTVTRLLRLARWSPVLPVPGSGRALVQPVFADDLGGLATALAGLSAPGVYAVGGPDIVSMRDFFAEIAAATGASRLILATPQTFLRVASVVPFVGFSAAQAERAERDRTAVPQTPLPQGLAPRTDLCRGLEAHLASMRAAKK